MTTVVTIQQGGTNANNAANALINLGAAQNIAVNVITGNAVTAIKANHYVLKNTSVTTVTLPASPTSGDFVWVTVANGLNTNIIGRNGNLIKGLAEDMTINVANSSIQLRYIDSSLGWQLC